MSLLLHIDSSLQEATVSVALEGKIITLEINSIQKDHAAFIHFAIEKLVKKFPLHTLDAIAVTLGPGSYTGLRVGLAAAKGLAYALNKPLVTINTLEAMAKTIIDTTSNTNNALYCPMIDARRMEIFTALYNHRLDEMLSPQAMILHANSFSEYLAINNIYFFGDGMQKWKDISTNEKAIFLPLQSLSLAIALLAYEKYQTNNFAHVPSITPLYVKAFFNQ